MDGIMDSNPKSEIEHNHIINYMRTTARDDIYVAFISVHDYQS